VTVSEQNVLLFNRCDDSTDSGDVLVYGANVTDNEIVGSSRVVYASSAPGQVVDASGAGSPEGVVTAAVGSIYRRTDGGAGTTLYMKESGTGATGWVAK